MKVDIQYVMAGMLIIMGFVTAWAGPYLAGERKDGTPGPVPPRERFWMRLFGVTVMACGVLVLVATLMGFRAPPAEGPVGP